MQPSAPVVTAYENALPDDDRIKCKRMFGSPCAFVNRQMFFGTFEETLVARIGPERVETVANEPGMVVFTPSPNKPWSDYVQLEPTTDPDVIAKLAAEALEWAAALPAKGTWRNE